MGSLTIDNINPHVIKAKYAVRGELAVRSEEYRAAITRGDTAGLPFSKVISANIGNPQQLDQKPITFFRQVLSILENPQLLKKPDVLIENFGYKSDVIARAEWLLSKAGSVGAYSASAGVPAIKDSIAAFLESRTRPVLQRETVDLTNNAWATFQGEMASPQTQRTFTSRQAPHPASIPFSTLSAPPPARAC